MFCSRLSILNNTQNYLEPLIGEMAGSTFGITARKLKILPAAPLTD